jgi:hypothetical protein
MWEAFFTDGEATVYGDSPALATILASSKDCCDETTPQGACCAPKPELDSSAPCCG